MELEAAYSWGWVGFAAFFAILEGFALANNKKGDTLSEHVWHLFSVKHEGKAMWLRRGVLWVFLGWLGIHLGTGII